MKFVMLSYHLSTNQNEALTITTPKTEKLNISNLFCFRTTLTIVQHFIFYVRLNVRMSLTNYINCDGVRGYGVEWS